MCLCRYVPQLLDQDLWFSPQLYKLMGVKNKSGETALINLFISDFAREVDFESDWFIMLL